MTTITTSLPDELVQKLSDYAKTLDVPKNKLIEKALSLYLDHLKRAAYVKSYKKAGNDEDMLSLAEEGMEVYLKQLEDETR
ncbi:ribbon-helix-helix domain-containing protein [Cecembia calidifontis]|uniref:Ribbon-helix-helix protein n=1 Tax=Cecembia calidifontis TaxID=1187080 RepID=A0A4Q7P4Z2_9BACT|nr:ribbon-helix-helix domain-containing protein [Cecembia calidifontis]RZS94757.1 ribbon-helix-helix protein [Cecembia calidifontis]